MLAAKILEHEVQRDSVGVIFDLLAVGIRSASKALDAHAHGQILTLYKTGRDMVAVRVANRR